MSTTKGSKRGTSNKSKARGRSKAGLEALKPKPDNDLAEQEEKAEKEKHERWRKRTKGKMKKSPRSTVREELPDVLVALLEQAEMGNCQPAKLLFEFADVETLPDEKEKEKSQSLTELLLSKIS